MKPILELENITKLYGSFTALHSIDLEVLQGEIFSLIGPNGSGKTTLLRIMAGIDKATNGSLRFNGVRVHENERRKLRLNSTLVFQKTTMFDSTVYKNIAYGLKLRGCSKEEVAEKVRQALKVVQLQGYEKSQARKLSGGEQQRVALARALALDTEILLLDEPTANIDPRNVSIIENALWWANREEGRTIVMATHNMFQAESLADRVAVLLHGRLRKVGKTNEIFEDSSKVLKRFVRLENVFSGISTVTAEGTSIVEVEDDLKVEAAFEKRGQTTIYVRPEDIILSNHPIASSARNTFEGRIVQILDVGPVVKLKVRAKKDFVVQVTKRSFNEMGLGVDSKAFLAFKASSVQAL